jgi:hypothetical protein
VYRRVCVWSYPNHEQPQQATRGSLKIIKKPTYPPHCPTQI